MHIVTKRESMASLNLYYDLVANYVVIIIGLVLWIQRCHTFPFDHDASSAWCIIHVHAVLAYNVSSLFCYNYYDIHVHVHVVGNKVIIKGMHV